ncbi:MAG: hypothetical protein ACI9RP_000934, partial [Cyclobacteriaceae bacterium]
PFIKKILSLALITTSGEILVGAMCIKFMVAIGLVIRFIFQI